MTSANSTRVAEQHISTDREKIREWADRHDAVPVRRGSDSTPDLLHKSEAGPEHEQLDWNTFYDELESENHAVFYHEDASEAPLGVMTHEQAIAQSDIKAEQIRDRLVGGETVTSTIQETTVVETAVVEEATLESTLVDREITDEELLDVELAERVCTDCNIVPSADYVDAENFDHDRYFASLEASRDESTQSIERSDPNSRSRSWVATNTQSSLPDTAEIDVRQIWTASREVTERFTVESRITETGVAEDETVEGHDVDVEGLQRSIVEQGMLDVEHDPDEVMREFDIESELGEGDRIHTYFTRTSVVEDEVIDHIKAHADITSTDLAEMYFAAADHVVSEEATETMDLAAEHVSLRSDDIGKDVVDATGDKIGTVEGITDGGQTAYVETHSSIRERIMSVLNWDDEDDHEMEIYAGQITRITDDEVRLKSYEQLSEHRQAHGSD